MKLLVLILICLKSGCLIGQNYIGRNTGYHKALNINVGYSYSFGDPLDKKFHILDVGINRSKYGGLHGGGFQYGIGSEFVLNTTNFTIGPKLSGIMYYQILAFGLEIVTYTDFNQSTLRLAPLIGIGGDKFRLTINPHIRLTNKDFEPINRGLINLSVNLSFECEKY